MVPRRWPLGLDHRKGGTGGILAVGHDTKPSPQSLLDRGSHSRNERLTARGFIAHTQLPLTA